DEIENDFRVPIYGTRELVRKEERDEDKNQYFLLKEGGVPVPLQFDKPEDIDRLVVVKTNEADRGYERAFFLVNSYEEFKKVSSEKLAAGDFTEESLASAVIEEFVLGP